jgi:hypothetical protein
MLVLDENLPAGQRLLLRSWRVRFRAIGDEIALLGTKDENLIPILHRLPNPTFVSLDRDFYRRDLAHPAYCVVWLDVRGLQAAEFIRRFLRHPLFNTQAKRMGAVVRVHFDGVVCWRIKHRSPKAFAWSYRRRN